MKNLFPLDQKMAQSKNKTKTFLNCMDAAKREQAEVDQVVSCLADALKEYIFEILSGRQWLGIRVRAVTHRINLTYQSITAYSVGTIADYCPSLDKHLVLFDEEYLQPQWLRCERKTVELEPDNSLKGGNPPELEEQIFEFSNPLAKVRAAAALIDSCFPCKYCGLEVANKLLMRCSGCSSCCHSYCMPPITYPTEPKTGKSQWLCPNCVACYGCYSNVWSTELIHWNIKSIEPDAADRFFILCGLCLSRYKQLKEFCPICYELYSDDSSGLGTANTKSIEEDAVGGSEDKEDAVNDPNKMVCILCTSIDQLIIDLSSGPMQ